MRRWLPAFALLLALAVGCATDDTSRGAPATGSSGPAASGPHGTTAAAPPGSTPSGTQPAEPRVTVPPTTPEAATERALARHTAGATTEQRACVTQAFRGRPDLVTAVTDSPAPTLDEITAVVLLLIECDAPMVVSGFMAGAPEDLSDEQARCVQEAVTRMSPTELAQMSIMGKDADNFAGVMASCRVVLPDAGTTVPQG